MTAAAPTEAALAEAAVASALVDVAARTRWPDGSLLIDLDEAVLRERLAPQLTAALRAAATSESHCTCPSTVSLSHRPQERSC